MGHHRCSYQVGDWGKYNTALRNRYDLEVWFPASVVKRWYYKPKKRKHGGQLTYSRTAILICHQLRALFQLSLRGTQGFLDSFFKRLNLPIRCPHYTQLSRRTKDLKTIKLSRKSSAPMFALIDSTGLKVYGQGEWHVRMHKASQRRTWRKLHLVVDPVSQEIMQDLMTVSKAPDAGSFLKVLPKLPQSIQAVWGDGAYATESVYKALYEKGITPIIPPQRNGTPSCFYRRTQRYLGKTTLIHHKPHMLPRDTALEYIGMYSDAEEGRKRWKQHSSYHIRSLVETAMMRFKQTFSDKLKSRTFQNQQAEVHLKAIMLNKMIHIAQANSFPRPTISL